MSKVNDKTPIGTKVIIVANSNHNIPIGTKTEIVSCYSRPGYWVVKGINGGQQTCLYSDLKIAIQTMEDLEYELKEAKNDLQKQEIKISTIESKIEFVNETGIDNFDDDEFRAYKTLKTLEDTNISIVEKAIKIASLFK